MGALCRPSDQAHWLRIVSQEAMLSQDSCLLVDGTSSGAFWMTLAPPRCIVALLQSRFRLPGSSLHRFLSELVRKLDVDWPNERHGTLPLLVRSCLGQWSSLKASSGVSFLVRLGHAELARVGVRSWLPLERGEVR